jgi:hypothetical protein
VVMATRYSWLMEAIEGSRYDSAGTRRGGRRVRDPLRVSPVAGGGKAPVG